MTLELTKIAISPLSNNLSIFGTFFIFGQMNLFVRSKRLKQLYSIETSRNERLPNNFSLLELTKKVMVQKPKIFIFFIPKNGHFWPKMKKVPKMDKLALKGQSAKFLSGPESYSVLMKKNTPGKKLCVSDTFELFVNFEILSIIEISNDNLILAILAK